MVELIVVIILVGILGAVAATRFFGRAGYDAASYGEQLRGMARYAQKLAIAQNRNVFVEGNQNGVGLCFVDAMPCPAASQVPTPAGTNSGNTATRAFCAVGGVYAPTWYCEAMPAGVSFVAASGASLAPFYFNGLGKPYALADAASAKNGINTDSSFNGLSITIAGDGSTFTLSVEPETGYVY